MEKKKIVVLPGDGIGPEIMTAGLKVLEAASNKFDFKYELDYQPFGGAGIDEAGDPLPEQTVIAAKAADAILLSAIGGPKWDDCPRRPEKGLLEIRSALGLFANIRPTTVEDIQIDRSPLKADRVQGTDFVIVRELTSGAYFGEPRSLADDKAIDTIFYSRAEIERIMKIGFDMAVKRSNHVTIVDKSNVLATSKLWRQIAEEVAQSYPTVTVDYRYVDAMAMAIIADPKQFDVVITPNLFGDILSDEAAEITGSIGQIPSVSAGSAGVNLYEPIHGSAPDIAGQGIANPISMIKTVAMMLDQSFDRSDMAQAIITAVNQVIEDQVVTADMGGEFGTAAVTDKIIEFINGGTAQWEQRSLIKSGTHM
ncbi:3-isopropylmalate dehydrogenase [Fructobacillus ficulneus]|uniref:3-isopropylmalate dehydrogenase n=1 Tax=Fructobacillus ficulneus TaxID=157463 RepID=A0A0K8MGE2_9LACO|nr:3-isopropylmalate dehydrogenase [Fructobacillus ficulneus]GAO99600.1 3-isopropylmalate dehydrogenase [Fructobacillus ficulneus]